MSETKPDLTLSLQETANSIEIQAADGTIVADLINEADCCVTESMRQYAALFAAAPGMLAALKVAQHSLRAWNAMGMSGDVGKQVAAAYENSPEMKVIAAAIAKAGAQ